MGNLENRTVVVIGASSGIGRGIALRAIRSGAEVIVAARRLDRLESLIAEAGGGHPLAMDLCEAADLERLVETVAALESSIDLVVISAGSAPLGRVEQISPDDWHTTLQTNLIGIHQAIAAVLPHLSPQAVVAVVSSESATEPRSHLGAYGASKAGLEHTLLQWQEEHPWLRFTTVSLGATVPTEFGHGFREEDIVEAIGAWASSGRSQTAFMDVEHVCNLLAETFGAMMIAPTVGMPRIELRSPAPPASGPDAAVAAAAASRSS